jgi:hypothetical protein
MQNAAWHTGGVFCLWGARLSAREGSIRLGLSATQPVCGTLTAGADIQASAPNQRIEAR